MLERLVKFEVLGQEYPLYTDAPEEDVREILELVKSQIEHSAQGGPQYIPANKLAILTSLNVAGKYVRLKKDFDQYRQKVDEYLGRLTEKIEETLYLG